METSCDQDIIIKSLKVVDIISRMNAHAWNVIASTF